MIGRTNFVYEYVWEWTFPIKKAYLDAGKPYPPWLIDRSAGEDAADGK